MFAVCIAEIYNWAANFRKRTVLTLVLVWMVLGIISKLRPEVCLEALQAVLLWIGLLSGKQSWSEITLAGWVQKARLTYLEVVCGKISATLVVGLIHAVVSLPILILMQIVWGLPWSNLFAILGLTLLGMLVVTLSALFGYSLVRSENEILLHFFLCSALVITGLVPPFRIINPFWQGWRIMMGSLNLPLVILVNVLLLLLLVVLEIQFLKQEVLQGNES